MTLSWGEIPSLKGVAQWTIVTVREYLSFRKVDPWEDYWRKRQTIASAMRQLRTAREG